MTPRRVVEWAAAAAAVAVLAFGVFVIGSGVVLGFLDEVRAPACP